MSMLRTRYCIANWKMNFNLSDAEVFVEEWKNKDLNNTHIKTIFCPSFTGLNTTSELLEDSRSILGAQNVYFELNGAYTGEVSCRMLKEVGCKWVIVGHSERRSMLVETDVMVQKKMNIIISQGMFPILCIGETKEERESGYTQKILSKQLSIACDQIDINEGHEYSWLSLFIK